MAILTAIGFLAIIYAIIKSLLAWTKGDYYYQAVPIGVISILLMIVDRFPNAPITISVLVVLSVMLLTILFYTGYKFFYSLLYGDIEWRYLSTAIFSVILLSLLFLKGVFI